MSAIDTFIDNIQSLKRSDLKAWAQTIGQPMREVTDPYTVVVFHSVIPDGTLERIPGGPDKSIEEDVWFQVGAMAAYDALQAKRTDDDGEPIPLAVAMRKVDAERQTDQFASRIANLLDTTWEDDGMVSFALAKVIRFITREGYRVDYKRLLRDALGWNDSDRYVAISWAQEYYNHAE